MLCALLLSSLLSPLPVLDASLQTSQRNVQQSPLVWVPLHCCPVKSTLFPTADIKGIPANKSRECTMISPRVGAIALSKPLFSPLPVLKASLQTSQRSVQRCPLVWVPLHYCTAKSTLFPTAGIGGVPANKSKERTMISPRVGAIALSNPLFSPLLALDASLQTSQRNVHRSPLVWVPLHCCPVKATLFPTAGVGGVPANESKECTLVSPRVGAIALMPCQSHSFPHCWHWTRPCKQVKKTYSNLPACGCHCTLALSKPLFFPLLALKASLKTLHIKCTLIFPRMVAIALLKTLHSPLPVLEAPLGV